MALIDDLIARGLKRPELVVLDGSKRRGGRRWWPDVRSIRREIFWGDLP